MTPGDAIFLQLAQARGLLSAAQAEEAMAAAREGSGRVGEIVVSRGWLRPVDRDAILSVARPALDAPTLATPPSGGAAPPTDAPPSAPCARLFGRYEVIEEVGRGGMGIVYKAWQTDLERFYDYADRAFDAILEAWGAEVTVAMTRRKFALLVDPKTGGGFSTSDIGEVRALTQEPSPLLIQAGVPGIDPLESQKIREARDRWRALPAGSAERESARARYLHGAYGP